MGTVVGVDLGGAFAASGLVIMAMMAASLATTGCTTHQCDPSTQDIYPRMDDAAVAGGFMIDENTFVTSSLDGTWLGFPGAGTLRIWFPPEAQGRVPLAPICDVGVATTSDCTPGTLSRNAQFASDSGITYAQVAGQLSEFNDVNTRRTDTDAGTFGGSFEVTNATCACYLAWCRVDFVPLDAMPSVTDDPSGEAGADAGTTSPDGAPGDAATE
jgi:hypothetical protein